MKPACYKLSRSRFQRDQFVQQWPVTMGEVVVRQFGDLKVGEQVANSAVYGSANDAFYASPLRSKTALELFFYEEYFPHGTSAYRAADSQTEVSAKRYRYTGKEKDEETGLYYHGARYYACWLGRWTAADPAGFGGEGNLYQYSRNRPTTLSDPSGGAPPEDPLIFRSENMVLLPPPPPKPPGSSTASNSQDDLNSGSSVVEGETLRQLQAVANSPSPTSTDRPLFDPSVKLERGDVYGGLVRGIVVESYKLSASIAIPGYGVFSGQTQANIESTIELGPRLQSGVGRGARNLATLGSPELRNQAVEESVRFEAFRQQLSANPEDVVNQLVDTVIEQEKEALRTCLWASDGPDRGVAAA